MRAVGEANGAAPARGAVPLAEPPLSIRRPSPRPPETTRPVVPGCQLLFLLRERGSIWRRTRRSRGEPVMAPGGGVHPGFWCADSKMKRLESALAKGQLQQLMSVSLPDLVPSFDARR